MLIPIGVLLAYGDSLWLPFHFDDIPHYRWLNGQSLGSIWLTAEGRPYYRPVQFFAWKLYETIFGRDSVAVFHGLSVLVHIVDALLVALVARRLIGAQPGAAWGLGMAAGLIFALFPFSYQAVPLPASFTHPMAVLFVLLAILAYDRFRTRGGGRWLVGAWACGLLAFASNESSLALPAAIALYEVLRTPRSTRWRWIILFALLAAAYTAWYQTRPRQGGGALSVQNGEAIVQNTMYALQGLTFPLQPAGRALMDWGLGDHAAVLLVGGTSLAGLAVVYVRAGQLRRWMWGVGWSAGFAALPILLLSHDYLINAPRVLYLASCGAAWLWSGAVALLWDVRRRPAAALLMAVLLAPSFGFIRERMGLYHLNAGPLQAAIEVTKQSDPAARLLFVNLPAWVSAPRFWYPIGHEGVLFMPGYASMADFVSVNTGRPSRAVGVEFNNLSTPQAYHYGVYGPPLDYDQLASYVRAAERVYFAAYAPESIELIEAGRLLSAAAPSGSVRSTFGGSLALEKVDWSVCANRLRVMLDWRAIGPPPGDVHIFVHVLDADGSLVAQHDSPPLLGLMPFFQWQAGDRAQDVHPIALSNSLENGPYAITVGLYDVATGRRLPAVLAGAAGSPDDAVPIASFTPGSAGDCSGS